jgi:hypothetical protein
MLVDERAAQQHNEQLAVSNEQLKMLGDNPCLKTRDAGD